MAETSPSGTSIGSIETQTDSYSTTTDDYSLALDFCDLADLIAKLEELKVGRNQL